MLFFCKLMLPNTPIVSSYHTNIALYAKMFGFGFLFQPIWATHRLYHGSSKTVLCPSYSTKEELVHNGFEAANVKVWSRGVDTALFNPSRRDFELHETWTMGLKNTSSADSVEAPDYGSAGKTMSRRTSDLDEGVHFGFESKTVLLYVGRISWEKNLRLLVSAFKTMNPEQYHLVIVGDGPARASIMAELEESKAGVTFTGYLKNEQLAQAYASSDVFVFPSHSETFGQVVLEAQASGLPVVAMRAEGVKEIVDHGKSGLLVEPLVQDSETENSSSQSVDWESLEVAMRFSDAIKKITETPGMLEKMGRGAVARSKKFTWTAAMNTCLDAYTQAIESA